MVVRRIRMEAEYLCSSDLWVAGSVSNAVDTGATAGVSYAVGEVQGAQHLTSPFY